MEYHEINRGGGGGRGGGGRGNERQLIRTVGELEGQLKEDGTTRREREGKDGLTKEKKNEACLFVSFIFNIPQTKTKGVFGTDLSNCARRSVTERHFVSCFDVSRTDLSSCTRTSMTERHFVSCLDVSGTDLSNCTRRSITERHFAYCWGVSRTDLSNCTRRSISERHFAYCWSISETDLSNCTRTSFTEVHLYVAGTLITQRANITQSCLTYML